MDKKLNKLICADVENINDWELIKVTKNLYYECSILNKRTLITDLMFISVLIFPYLSYLLLHSLNLIIFIDLVLCVPLFVIEIYLIKITGAAVNVYADYLILLKEKYIEALNELNNRGYRVEDKKYRIIIKKEN